MHSPSWTVSTPRHGRFRHVLFGAREDFEMWLRLVTNGRRIVFVPVVLGYYYALPGSMATDPKTDLESKMKIKRVFNQVNAREHLMMKTEKLRYHPAIGYL